MQKDGAEGSRGAPSEADNESITFCTKLEGSDRGFLAEATRKSEIQ